MQINYPSLISDIKQETTVVLTVIDEKIIIKKDNVTVYFLSESIQVLNQKDKKIYYLRIKTTLV